MFHYFPRITYPVYSTSFGPTTTPPSGPAPIRVTPKPKRRKRASNVFIDDRGFPDQSDEFDTILHNVSGGPILRKRKHPAPALDDIDPAFASQYVEAQHGAKLRKELDLSHLDPTIREQVYALVQKYWSVFDDKGQHVPVKDYECVIDTGNAKPIAMKKIHYGPRETPIMRKCISALLELGHIRQIHDGQWLFKALLAPKPHQESITNIDDFVWRFCVNYIPLNQITRVVAYPIPRCDAAVNLSFGKGTFFWLFDAPSGFHQLAVAKESQAKLAFAGPDATKYTYQVMPFGPVNGPMTFIMFMFDLRSTWNQLAIESGVTIDDDTNCNIIVDDILCWAPNVTTALQYMECQLQVAQSQNLSLSLKKTHIFPKRFEFVGTDVCHDGNRPAMSKHQLLNHWRKPELVRDIAKFVGFIQFYSRFIPNMEIRIEPLRDVLKHEHTALAAPFWTEECSKVFQEMQNAILADPCLVRYDHRKLLVLRTDFSSKGFGYVATQPADDDASLSAMHEFMNGGEFTFMKKDSLAILKAVAFGSRRTRGNEIRLHSHLGEGFSGDWSINKCRHMCFGQRFVWVTDCFAIKFILSYDGRNASIMQLQMRLMCWDMVIVHRNDHYLTDADYWSRVEADLCYDPLLKDYIEQVNALRRQHTPPTDLPMRPENMPYYRGPCTASSTESSPNQAPVDKEAQAIVSSIMVDQCHGFTHLENWPVRFGDLEPSKSPTANPSRVLYNSNIPAAARQLDSLDCAVYSFNSGHFISAIQSRNLPIKVQLACDPYSNGRALFAEFTSCKTIFTGASELLHHVRSSGIRSILHMYLIHSHRYSSSEPTRQFWTLQASIVIQMRLIRSLSLFVAFVHPDHDSSSVKSFCTKVRTDGWVLTSTPVSYPDYGDSVADSCRLIIGVHTNTEEKVAPLSLKTPPATSSPPLSSFIWAPFNMPDKALSFSKDDLSFNRDIAEGAHKLITTEPAPSDTSPRLSIKYHLHRDDMDTTTLSGAAVYSQESLCPPFCSAANHNFFQHYFGIEFKHDDHTYVRSFSPFEFVSCFRLSDDLTYKLSHPQYKFSLDAGIPALTSMWLFDYLIERLLQIRDANCEIFNPSHHAAPAAPIQAFLSGAVGVRLPTKERWVQAYKADKELSLVRDLVLNPSKISSTTLKDINYNFHGPLRKSQIHIEDDMLIYHEPVAGYDSYVRLQLVPKELYNLLFVAFHSNPIGGHFNAYRTLHRIRLRFYWPGMYSYITKMCKACPGCTLSNPTRSKSAELVYNFPIEAPFMVLHIDGYMAGKQASFEGAECYIIGCCGMSTFSAMEPVTKANATSYASAIMKIMLRYGFSHTVVLDKDSKFFGVCREALQLLKINMHALSGDNHNPMIVERLNRYLNKGLKIMINERDSSRVVLEALLLLIYAWNSCPVPGTDISRSLVAVGREFQFPIDFSSGKHWELVSSPSTVETYATELASRLSACHEVAQLLVQEQRAWHRELINSRRRDPRIYSVGDIVFACRATKSNAQRGQVGKLMYPFTGPWRVTEVLDGASYKLEHCSHNNRTDKKHASDLTPYPEQLIPFEPVDGADNRYGQIHMPIGKTPFAEAGIQGFKPPQPFKVSSNFLTVGDFKDFHWPTLSELNDELDPFPWSNNRERRHYLSGDSIETSTVMYNGPPPTAPPPYVPPTIPALSMLVSSIIQSQDKLFFVANSIGTDDAREWRLVRVAFEDSMKLYPACLQDGKFLVDFYIPHTSDTRFNAINQRYWLQYHGLGDITTPSNATDTHLIRPSDTSEAYASRHKLVPYRKWLNLTHEDTYIHGPFEFATIRGRKSRDRISQVDWDVLSSHQKMFKNEVPRFDVPTYSIHVDPGVHAIVCDPKIAAHLVSSLQHNPSSTDQLYC